MTERYPWAGTEHYPWAGTVAGVICKCGEFLDAQGICIAEVTRCPKWSLGGAQCQLQEGHDGEHSARNGSFRWTDESQQELYRRYGGRS
jgi:hypothetical protein